MPNPTTINEDQLMNISETITKLRERAEALMNLTDDVCEIIAVNPVLREYLSASNAINILKILDHFEARESEKPREWWNCLFCGAPVGSGPHICDPRMKRTAPKKTDEELVELMCAAGFKTGGYDIIQIPKIVLSEWKIVMRAALAVVREEMK